ncbi:MAG: Mur ligase family protein [Burkholderiaceae bacterium]|jgi:UDP-N-acetylmuramoyl-tripeptide--D-alanyl-D-alanine ligase|nr:Mur ligase family protein [Burkholderiaceae bacterium]
MQQAAPRRSSQLDAPALARLTGGQWTSLPPSEWRYGGLCCSAFDHAPGQLVLVKTAQMEYGVDRERLDTKLARSGLLAAPDSDLSGIRAPVLQVDSVPEALRALVAHLRQNSATTAVAVTGSVGKTSSCQLLKHLLSRQGSVRSNGQKNFHDGVLCQAANLGTADFLVVEVSLQALLQGATAELRPHVALLTHVSPVHMDLHSGLAELTEKKASIFAHLPSDGTAVINRDLEHFERAEAIARRSGARIVTFGESQAADCRLLDYDAESGTVTARFGNEHLSYRLSLPGRHMALDSLGVLAAAHAAGADLNAVVAECATVQPAIGRSRIEKLRVCGRHITVVDDSYNASPASMQAAFGLLASLRPGSNGRRIAVLGDMLELGVESRAQHEALAEPLRQAGITNVLLCGEAMHALRDRLASSCQVRWFDSPGEMLEPLARSLCEGDVILFKGSHGSHVREVAAQLRLLSLLPAPVARLQQSSVSAFLLIQNALEWARPRAPAPLRRWVNWQFQKLGGLV